VAQRLPALTSIVSESAPPAASYGGYMINWIEGHNTIRASNTSAGLARWCLQPYQHDRRYWELLVTDWEFKGNALVQPGDGTTFGHHTALSRISRHRF